MNSPSMFYSEYVFTSLKKVDQKFIDLELHLKRLEFQIINYYSIDDVTSLLSDIRSELLSLNDGDLRVRINVFSKDRESIYQENFRESDLKFSLNVSKLKNKREKVKLKTFSFYQDQKLSDFKLPNYSASFYLKRLAKKENFDDILYISQNNEIIESSTSNIIFRIDEEWVTSKLCIYKGLSRQKLIESKKVILKDIKISDLDKATDAVLINSIEDFVVVEAIDNKNTFSNKNILELFNE